MLINNLTEILNDNILEEKYYVCDKKQAEKLFLAGFPLASAIEEGKFIFYKSVVLMEFLQKGE